MKFCGKDVGENRHEAHNVAKINYPAASGGQYNPKRFKSFWKPTHFAALFISTPLYSTVGLPRQEKRGERNANLRRS
jgi:hypothetical protein